MTRQEIKGCILRFIKDEDGATAIEYGLFASLISLLIIAGVTNIGTALQSTFNNVNCWLTTGAACP